MLRTTLVILALGSFPRACTCADADRLVPSTSVSSAASDTSTSTTPVAPPVRAENGASVSAGGGFALPDGIGPVTGGRCTAPADLDVRITEPLDATLEERLFGTRGAELSVKAPEDCP